jgi:hypothetical protein
MNLEEYLTQEEIERYKKLPPVSEEEKRLNMLAELLVEMFMKGQINGC